MHRARRWAGVVALVAAVAAARADDPKPKGEPPKEPPKKAEAPKSPAEQYQALVKEFQGAQQEFFKEYQAAKTQEERQKLYQEKYPRPDKFADRFLKLAEDHPKDPAAVDALVWVCTNAPGGTAGQNALETLLKDHLQSDKLAAVCPRLIYAPDGEKTLRTLLEKSPHRDVQGSACFSLGQLLKGRADRGGANAEATAKEAEALFERVEKDFADVKQYNRTLGQRAKGELNEIRNLRIGKEAPDIAGEDIDGVKFKLSDYRGKVVLLDFWGHW
jgi:hypothetical protein